MHQTLQKIYSNNRTVQENFHLITPLLRSLLKSISPKKNRPNSSVPWLTPEIRRKILKRKRTYATVTKTSSNKLWSKFEYLRRETKAGIIKHDLYVNNLVGDIKANSRDFYGQKA